MFRPLVFLTALAAPAVLAQSQPKCGGGQLCPEATPCCSAYGQCGIGAYCLGGCDPLNSFKIESCVPAPVCQTKNSDFNSLNGIVDQGKYLGDATKADWVVQGEPLAYQGSVLLTMAQGTVGTLMASTHYVWYGKIKAKMQTSAGKGVVTAFILMSDVKDEIDFEFVGDDLSTAQTNFYSQGVTNYNNGKYISGVSDTRANFHEYEIDWTPETLTWLIDGKEVRQVKKSDTWNATANRYSYPQTPSRVMLSLWPAGLESNGQGTIEWAGGLIDWSSQYMTNGYYYAPFDYVNIECYQPPTGAKVNGKTSYVYTDKRATNDTVETTDKPTVLKSLLGTGTNMSADYASASGSASASQTDMAVIPGLSGAGAGANGQRGEDDANNDGSGSNGGDSGDDGSSGGSGFVQNSNQGKVNSAPGGDTAALSSSFFAVVVAIVGLCMM